MFSLVLPPTSFSKHILVFHSLPWFSWFWGLGALTVSSNVLTGSLHLSLLQRLCTLSILPSWTGIPIIICHASDSCQNQEKKKWWIILLIKKESLGMDTSVWDTFYSWQPILQGTVPSSAVIAKIYQLPVPCLPLRSSIYPLGLPSSMRNTEQLNTKA